MTIKEIHDNVFNHLIKNHPNIYFTLRKTDKGGRLSKGYWFLGNDDIISFSFWKGNDPLHKTPHISYSIKSDGTSLLEFVDWRASHEGPEVRSEKRTFFDFIAKPLRMTARISNDKAVNKWVRHDSNTNYLKTLDDFIQGDKDLLDRFIALSKVAEELAPISKTEFEQSLQIINKFRDKPVEIEAPPSQVKLPLRVEHLILRNISHFAALELDLRAQVTCLIGENGSGKTTILRAIAFGLVGFKNQKFVTEDVPILYDKLKNFLKIKQAKNQEIVYESNGYIELFYTENKKNRIEFKPLTAGVDEQGQLRSVGAIDIDDSKSDFKALDAANNFKNLVLGFSQCKNAPIEKLPLEDSPEKASVLGIFNLLINEVDFSFKMVHQWISQVFNQSLHPEKRVELIKVLKIAFEIMSEITGDKLELGDMNPHKEPNPLVKTPDAPQGIPLDLVSQGYGNVIGWVGYLVKRMSEVTPMGQDFRQTSAICLIDEIDTYLYPKWQSNIVSTLVDTFRNIQFIVTTHSPLVLARLHKPASDYKPSYKIFKLIQQDGIVTAEEALPNVFNPYGAESSRVLRLLMNVEERPKDVKQLFESYHRAIAKNDFETAQSIEKTLEQLIDRHDPILVNGAAEIETRKIIQSL